jgi:hypothetical protein
MDSRNIAWVLPPLLVLGMLAAITNGATNNIVTIGYDDRNCHAPYYGEDGRADRCLPVSTDPILDPLFPGRACYSDDGRSCGTRPNPAPFGKSPTVTGDVAAPVPTAGGFLTSEMGDDFCRSEFGVPVCRPISD